jgi:hypothetical protein
MERRRIDELIRSTGQDWRAIEKVEKRLHVQSPWCSRVERRVPTVVDGGQNLNFFYNFFKFFIVQSVKKS